MAAKTSSAGSAAKAAKGPYTGENPHTEGTPAWHGWEYLKATVNADRARGIDVTKVEKAKLNTHAF